MYEEPISNGYAIRTKNEELDKKEVHLELTTTFVPCIVEIVLPPGDEYDQVVRKSEQYSKRAEAIWETRSESTVPAKDVKELPAFERLAQEAQVWTEEMYSLDESIRLFGITPDLLHVCLIPMIFCTLIFLVCI